MNLKSKIGVGDTVLVRGSRYGIVNGINEERGELTVAIWKNPKEVLHVNFNVLEKSVEDTLQVDDEKGGVDEEFIEELVRVEAKIPSLHLTYTGREPT